MWGLAEQVVGHLDEIICGAWVVNGEVKELNAAIHEFLRRILADFIGIHFVSPGNVDAAVCIVAGFLVVTAAVRGKPAASIEPRPGFGILSKFETGVEIFIVGHCNHCAFRWRWKINADSLSNALVASLSNHIFVGLAEHGEVNGIAGNFHLDVLHGGAIGEVGGGENGGSDEGDGGEDFQNRFHGDASFLGWKMGIKIAPQQVAGRFWNNI